jgi:hypothetical protein
MVPHESYTLGVDDFNFNSNLQIRNCIFSRLYCFTKSPNVRPIKKYRFNHFIKYFELAPIPLLGKETKLSYLSYKLLCTLSIEENVHFVWIKYLKELSDETGYSS